MSRKRLDPTSLTRPLTIKVSEVLLADVRAATVRTGQTLGEYVREALALAIARGGTR